MQPIARDERAAVVALTRRELIRFVRQPTRVAASLGTPVLLWVFIASGLSGSFVMPGGGEAGLKYGAYLLPGVVLVTILFTSIFAAISLIQDRQAGLLQSALVSPAPRWAIAGSKIAGGAIVAGAQAVVLVLAAPFVGLEAGFFGLVGAIVASLLASVAVVGLSLAVAWWVDSTAGFHGVMNMVLMPLWLLSGALFPVAGASAWLGSVVRFNPMFWCHASIAGSLGAPPGMHLGLAWLGAFGTAAAMAGLGWAVIAFGDRRLGASGPGVPAVG